MDHDTRREPSSTYSPYGDEFGGGIYANLQPWLDTQFNDCYANAVKDNAGQVEDDERSATGNYVFEDPILSDAITASLLPGTRDDDPGSGGDCGLQHGNHGAAAPAADVDQPRRLTEEQNFQVAYEAAKIKHRDGAAALSELIPLTRAGKRFCKECIFWRVIFPKMGQSGPLRDVELDPTQVDELHNLFKAEVSHPTLARAHEHATKGQNCPIFPPRSDHFSIPQDKLWGRKLRQWHDQAKKP
jgi:hypothetical protein